MQRQTRWYRAEIEAAASEHGLDALRIFSAGSMLLMPFDLSCREFYVRVNAKPLQESNVVDVKFSSKFRNCPFLSGVAITHVLALVTVLFSSGGPSTVAMLVVPVVVDSVKAATLWASSHVSEEGCEIVGPLCGHGYSSAAIVAKLPVGRKEASQLGVLPSRILDAHLPVSLFSVSSEQALVVIDMQASATLCPTTSHGAARANQSSAAITLTDPLRLSAYAAKSSLYQKPSESLASDVNEAHNVNFTT